MSIFKQEREIKRMIFNIYADIAERLESLKSQAKSHDKRLDVDTAVNKALEKFILKAEKKIEEMNRDLKDKKRKRPAAGSAETEVDIPLDENTQDSDG